MAHIKEITYEIGATRLGSLTEVNFNDIFNMENKG